MSNRAYSYPLSPVTSHCRGCNSRRNIPILPKPNLKNTNQLEIPHLEIPNHEDSVYLEIPTDSPIQHQMDIENDSDLLQATNPNITAMISTTLKNSLSPRVAELIKATHLNKYAKMFVEKNINLLVVLMMKTRDLRKLGIVDEWEQINILAGAKGEFSSYDAKRRERVAQRRENPEIPVPPLSPRVSELLTSLKLTKHLTKFREEEIDFLTLLMLRSRDLEKLGIREIERNMIFGAAKDYFKMYLKNK